jgi:hypothetical protein
MRYCRLAYQKTARRLGAMRVGMMINYAGEFSQVVEELGDFESAGR